MYIFIQKEKRKQDNSKQMVVEARKKRKSNKLQNMQKLKPDWKKKMMKEGQYLIIVICL